MMTRRTDDDEERPEDEDDEYNNKDEIEIRSIANCREDDNVGDNINAQHRRQRAWGRC